MKKYVGIWIDFEKAYVVSIEKSKKIITRIDSEVEGRVLLAGGSRSVTPYGPQDVASERKVEERRKHHLRKYYQRVIRAIDDADKILIFGPGEAKIQFEKEIIKSKKLKAKIAAVERADKMTEPQIAAKVRDFFNLHQSV
jgi:stalled ribosome rescue protein Dom34